MPGRLINTNTVDAFKAMDKNALLESVGKEVRPAPVRTRLQDHLR